MCHPRTAPSRGLCMDLLAWMHFSLSFLYSSDMPQKWLKVTQCAVSGVLSHIIERSPWVTGLVCISWIKRAVEGVYEDRALHDNVSFSVSEQRPVGRCPEVLPQCLCNGEQHTSACVSIFPLNARSQLTCFTQQTDERRGERWNKASGGGGEKDYAVYWAWTQQR